MNEKEMEKILIEAKEDTPHLWKINSRSADIKEDMGAIRPLLI